MKRRNIIKALALAMLLTTACVNNEIPNENGYALPVTVNVTRQGNDPATKAEYNKNGDNKLEFSAGDQLFILGGEYGEGMPGWFYGTLTWQSGGTFSGTLTTENEYTGTIDAIIGSSHVYLLPAGYGNYGFLTVSTGEGWDASVEPDFSKTFALTKAIAVEQFSFELGGYNSLSGCIELEPMMAILNFTITGLTPSTEYAVVLNNGTDDVGGNVKTGASGNATFAVSVLNDTESENLTLTVGGNTVALNLDGANNRTLAKGKIYNIYRDVTATRVDLSTISGYYILDGDVILTGTPAADLTITNNDGYTVTLDNVNPAGTATVRMNCGSDFTLKLKGTSKFTRIFDIGCALTISEAVAGGTVIINNSTGYALAAATVTVNGGTVKAKSENVVAINANLAVNGGAVYLAGAGDNAVNGTISGSATLYGWNGSAWDAATGVQYVTTDNSAAPSSWTW
jgi:hypothetical protein